MPDLDKSIRSVGAIFLSGITISSVVFFSQAFVSPAFASCNQLTSGTSGLFAPNTNVTPGTNFDCYVFTNTQFHDTTCVVTVNNDINNPLLQADVHNDCT